MPRSASVYAAGAWRTVSDLHVYAAGAWQRAINAWVYNGMWLLFHALQTPDWLQDWSGNANHLTADGGLGKIKDQSSEVGAYPTDDGGLPHMLLLDDPERAVIAFGDINSPKLKGGFTDMTVAFRFQSINTTSGVICGTWGPTDTEGRIWKIVLDNSGSRVKVWYFNNTTGNPEFREGDLTLQNAWLDEDWHTVVVTFDLDNGTGNSRIQVTVDGSDILLGTGTVPPTSALPTASSAAFHVGQDDGGSVAPTTNLGELAIYGSAIPVATHGAGGEDWHNNGLPIGTVLAPDGRLIAAYRWRNSDFVEDPGTPPPTIQPPSNPTAEALNTSEIYVTAEVHTDTSDGVRVYWKAGGSMLGDPVENSDGFEDLAINANDLGETIIDGLAADTDHFFQFAGTIDAGGPNEEIGTNYSAEIQEATLAPGGGGAIAGFAENTAVASISKLGWKWSNPTNTTDVQANIWDDNGELIASDHSLGAVESFAVDGGGYLTGAGVRAEHSWQMQVRPVVSGVPQSYTSIVAATAKNLNAPSITGVTDDGNGRFIVTISDNASGEDRFEVHTNEDGLVHTDLGGGGRSITVPTVYPAGTTKNFKVRAAGDTSDGPYQTGAFSNTVADTIPLTAPSPLTIDVSAISPWQVNVTASGGLPSSSWKLRRGVGTIGAGADWDAVPIVQSDSGTRPDSREDPQGEGQLSPGQTYTWRLTATNDGLDTHSNVVTVTLSAVTPDVLSQFAREQTTGGAGYRADCVFHVNSAGQSARILWSEWDENGDVVRTREFLQDMDVSPNGGPYVSNLVNSGQCHQVKFFIQVWNQDTQQGDMVEESAPAGSEARLLLNNFGADNCDPGNL